MNQAGLIYRVAVPTPLRHCFDYLAPKGKNVADVLEAGIRVRIPFGRRTVVGMIVGHGYESSVDYCQLKPIEDVLDAVPLIPGLMLEQLTWASRYYHYPIGEVILGALPTLLRKGRAAQVQGQQCWQLSNAGWALEIEVLQQMRQRAPRQAHLLTLLRSKPTSLTAEEIQTQQGSHWRTPMRRLEAKGWVKVHQRPCLAAAQQECDSVPTLHDEQQHAVDEIGLSLFGKAAAYRAYLLDGVTGSGKTEVYLQIISKVIAEGRQALVLVPEIGLTPQLVQRFRQRLPCPVAVLHSGLSDQDRLYAWLAGRDGTAPVIIGTRSAVFTPLKSPGVIIVDEEHDLSFKQQDGFRYSARDLAVLYAHRVNVPIILGSATPSLETLQNAHQGRFHYLRLERRAADAKAPRIHILDVRQRKIQNGFSETLLEAMQVHLQQQGQVMLFLNRRGYAPTLLCHDCGWIASCKRCDTHMVFHQYDNRLRCHHCNAERTASIQCPDCNSQELRHLGLGTERVEQTIQQYFPDCTIVRIDRDTTRRKGAMQAFLDDIQKGHAQILIGTQMLAKGHHFPNVTLVGILDADQGLYSADFRASERMAQLILQVAGRAGRAQRPGEVLIQTHHPDHPLLITLVQNGYHAFTQALLKERLETCLPPYSYLALLRAEAVDVQSPTEFLNQARDLAQHKLNPEVQMLGPVPAPMERRAGRFRAQLLLQAQQRIALQNLLPEWVRQLEDLKSGRKVRWTLDVDPMETY